MWQRFEWGCSEQQGKFAAQCSAELVAASEAPTADLPAHSSIS